MDKFIFKNLDSNQEISVPIDKYITYIYGGNGTGKTTFSRAFAKKTDKNIKVFNLDFINQNVYIVDKEGAKLEPSTKESFSNLFISTKAVEHANNMTNIKDLQKQTESLYNSSFTLFLSDFKKYNLVAPSSIDGFFNKITTIDNVFDWKKTC